MEVSIINSKGQLIIPERLQKKYGINSGVKVIFEESDKGLLIIPMNKKFFKSFVGILSNDGNLKKDRKYAKQQDDK